MIPVNESESIPCNTTEIGTEVEKKSIDGFELADLDGLLDIMKLGSIDRSNEGEMDGTVDDMLDGTGIGKLDRSVDGASDGIKLGKFDGILETINDGMFGGTEDCL